MDTKGNSKSNTDTIMAPGGRSRTPYIRLKVPCSTAELRAPDADFRYNYAPSEVHERDFEAR